MLKILFVIIYYENDTRYKKANQCKIRGNREQFIAELSFPTDILIGRTNTE